LTFADTLPTIADMKQGTVAAEPETVSVGNVTVRLYRRVRQTTTGKSRTIYEIADYTGGKRKLRGFSDRDKALKEARRIARTLTNGNAQAAMMRNTDAASYGRSIELVRPTGATLEIASATFAEAFEILGGNSIIEAARFYARHRPTVAAGKTVAEVVAEYIEAKRRNDPPFSVSYLKDLEYRLGGFKTAFAVDISNISGPDLQRFLDGIPNAVSYQKTRTIVGALFGFAERRGYVGKGLSPISDTERRKTRAGVKEVFTADEIEKLLRAAPTDYLPALAIGAFAGMRQAEIAKLQWSEIDMDAGRINIPRHKAKGGRKTRLIPILPNLAAWLKPYADRTGTVWRLSAGSLEKARKETVKAAGVPWKNNGLRDSFISYRLADTQAEQQVALEAGNSPGVVFNHYRTVVTQAEAIRYFSVTPDKEKEAA
jgi:integrase